MTPVQIARTAFDAMKDDDLQARLSAWQARNFGAATVEQMALGVAEEAGELAHAVLKHSQKIRGMDDPEKFRTAAGDAIADTAIYLMQLSTALRLDFVSLCISTAENVMQRDWKADPKNGEKCEHAYTYGQCIKCGVSNGGTP